MNIAQKSPLIDTTRQKLQAVTDQIDTIILGKERVVRLALSCLMARGHLLIEDRPGVGKTTLAHALSQSIGLSFQRVQFTSDMLPADILGVSVYEQQTGQFKFHAGPIFSQLILADEVNRATPRTQSALLEAMEENQVTIEGTTYKLPTPFFVIATQNPSNQVGTFPLPESQLDRFAMRVGIGYPGDTAEKELLRGRDRRELLRELEPVITPEELTEIQNRVTAIHVADPLVCYLRDLLEFSRKSPGFESGLSPRAGLAIRHCAQAWALLHGRDHVIPEDVQSVVPSVVGHRLTTLSGDIQANDHHEAAARLVHSVPIP